MARLHYCAEHRDIGQKTLTVFFCYFYHHIFSLQGCTSFDKHAIMMTISLRAMMELWEKHCTGNLKSWVLVLAL